MNCTCGSLRRKAAKPLTPIFQTLINSRVIEDLCFYQSPENDQLSVFVIGDRGGADQLLLRQQRQWLKAPLEIRQLGIPYDSKACAVNASTQALYVSEAGSSDLAISGRAGSRRRSPTYPSKSPIW